MEETFLERPHKSITRPLLERRKSNLFKDVCHFQQSGHINEQNMYVCASGYPHKYTKLKIINNIHVRVKRGEERNRRLLEHFINS